MNAPPFLSLVLTAYNQEHYIREALLSVLAQDYEGRMELIVVDDASTDATPSIIQNTLQEHGDGWDYRLIRRDSNGGVAQATDDALQAARGEWIVILDGDDIQLPDRCRKTAELITQHPHIVLINMAAELIDGDGHTYGKKSYAFAPFETAPQETVCATPAERSCNYLTYDDAHIDVYGCAMAIRLDVYRHWGKLATEMRDKRFAQDAPWALRAYLSGAVLGSLHIACRYRSHQGNILNRSWKGGLEGIRSQELFQSRYQSFFAATHRRMLADTRRAAREPGLSDWPAPALSALEKHELRELRVAELRSDWWSIPWTRRLARALCSPWRIPRRMALWPWLRLLPLPLVCRIRALK